jgi:hypothetical protein
MIHFIFAIVFIIMLWSIFDKRFAIMWYNCRDYLPIPGLPTTGDLSSYIKAFKRVQSIILAILVIIYVLAITGVI